MGFWKKQSKTEMQMQLSYAIKKSIAQLEKRTAQLEKLFRQKYITAQEAKALGDKKEAIKLLEECQKIDEESKNVKKELFKLNRAEGLIEYLVMLPEISDIMRATSSSEEIDPAKILGIVSNLEEDIAQASQVNEKLGSLPIEGNTQELPSPPMEGATESDFHEELSQETEPKSVQPKDVIDTNQKNPDASKKEKEVKL